MICKLIGKGSSIVLTAASVEGIYEGQVDNEIRKSILTAATFPVLISTID